MASEAVQKAIMALATEVNLNFWEVSRVRLILETLEAEVEDAQLKRIASASL